MKIDYNKYLNSDEYNIYSIDKLKTILATSIISEYEYYDYVSVNTSTASRLCIRFDTDGLPLEYREDNKTYYVGWNPSLPNFGSFIALLRIKCPRLYKKWKLYHDQYRTHDKCT